MEQTDPASDVTPPAPPCPPEARLAVPLNDQDHRRGPASAPVVLVEYGDYECPDCINAEPVVTEVRRRLGDRLAVVFRHFPRNSIHRHASAAAAAAEAAGAQGRYWDMHALLLSRRQDLADADLTSLALSLGLEVYQFQADMESPRLNRRIRDDAAGGERSGVRGTPTFFINGCRYEGPPEVEPLLAALEAAGGAGPD
jgi:protein-disulfide isomerase